MVLSGMNTARLNFSHGSLAQHRQDIESIRSISHELDIPVSILADLPGPKIRIGAIEGGSCVLKKGQRVVLTTQDVTGSSSRIPVLFPYLTKSVHPGSRIFLNDGFIQLRVRTVDLHDVVCSVITGGVLLSGKGLNLPGAELPIATVTQRDLDLVDFGLQHGIRLFGISFVRTADDIRMVRDHAGKRVGSVCLIAKIERSEALKNIDEILDVSDGIMIARGDLGVEIPIERVPVTQKELIFKANLAAKPVITATQMLESMTGNIRPTRAEATDVANAILDGTDAVMLSEETAIGTYPVESLKMMTRIARITERQRERLKSGWSMTDVVVREITTRNVNLMDLLSLDAVNISRTVKGRCIVSLSSTGSTARRISRFKTGSWVIALCSDGTTLEHLNLSYGVIPVRAGESSLQDSIGFLKKGHFLRPGEIMIVVERVHGDHIPEEQRLKVVRIPRGHA